MDDRIISRLIQIGTVMAVSGTKARVRHEDSGIISDWLPVLQRTDEVVAIQSAGSHTHDGSAGSAAGTHTHTAAVTSWVPNVNDKVVCVYLPMQNSDGFIIGRI